jgi:hypothetical protein
LCTPSLVVDPPPVSGHGPIVGPIVGSGPPSNVQATVTVSCEVDLIFMLRGIVSLNPSVQVEAVGRWSWIPLTNPPQDVSVAAHPVPS